MAETKTPTRSVCRSCGAAIVWAKSAATGKAMPLDADPVPGGNVVLGDDGVARVITAQAHEQLLETFPGTPLRVSHFSTCEHAASHRRKA